ncbi:ABC transporter substrate-binding protein [Corynebacterium pygosceleis]|uniref:ABC transporter substrate-binding protein n=1 Tax=Corynebacterium pygosceleis TaxID=2800406 RepID=A0A9Q4C920_9CORY|nr:ABC transporter substrate-binding protein [Corynebacterium pygosceleis]MCK7636932.1 ABC transporter substrate-binding protein [Corynebacterium pygosceleis]MCK7674406.1 ABC transporter substrate-binding protein [Corynebacterium pygosceleis]MCL0120296.1 ABC transporter substrate-binding protein [Corynebacterium pygosceleis]MCX7467685.1 ABC transporter substrate-binding protein [Corynebacterium pygosceleis]
MADVLARTTGRSVPRTARLCAVLSAVILSGAACTSGSGGPEEPSPPPEPARLTLATSSPLATTNAAGLLGASTSADTLAGRLYPPAFVHGPSGQQIPNRDLVTAQTLPGPEPRVVYTINPEATYSDGAPVTCTDFLLSYKAGTLPGLFDAFLPLTAQVKNLECAAGAREFTLIFNEGMGARWRQFFGPGTVLPAHAIAAKAGVTEEELVTALVAEDVETLRPVAEIWNTGFNLDNFDPALQVSSGPFTIDRVDDDGTVLLRRNDRFNGDPAEADAVVVWPKGTDIGSRRDEVSAIIADFTGGTPVDWVHRDEPGNTEEIEYATGVRIEQLVIGDGGVLSTPESRAAFAACVDQPAVAAASSQLAGQPVPAMAVRLSPAGSPATNHDRPVADAHLGVDLPRARLLSGSTVRIGYLGPDPRFAAMVEAIRVSCEPAGITVVDASAEGTTLGDLVTATHDEWWNPTISDGNLDALLVALGPEGEYGSVNVTTDDLEGFRAAEERLWQDIPTIPLAAEPRTFVVDRNVGNVVVNTGNSGIGWNMDRWQESEGQ